MSVLSRLRVVQDKVWYTEAEFDDAVKRHLLWDRSFESIFISLFSDRHLSKIGCFKEQINAEAKTAVSSSVTRHGCNSYKNSYKMNISFTLGRLLRSKQSQVLRTNTYLPSYTTWCYSRDPTRRSGQGPNPPKRKAFTAKSPETTVSEEFTRKCFSFDCLFMFASRYILVNIENLDHLRPTSVSQHVFYLNCSLSGLFWVIALDW